MEMTKIDNEDNENDTIHDWQPKIASDTAELSSKASIKFHGIRITDENLKYADAEDLMLLMDTRSVILLYILIHYYKHIYVIYIIQRLAENVSPPVYSFNAMCCFAASCCLESIKAFVLRMRNEIYMKFRHVVIYFYAKLLLRTYKCKTIVKRERGIFF